MTDTSLKNSRGLYCQEQRGVNEQFRNNIWKYKCISTDTRFPCFGVNMPMMTGGYNNGILSKNASDIESALFGIGSTNLVKTKPEVTPTLNCMNNINFFNRLETILPAPLACEKFQRPVGPFS